MQDQRPIKEIVKEEAELKTALEDLEEQEPSVSDAAEVQEPPPTGMPQLSPEAGPQDETNLPRPSEMSWTQEGISASDLASERLRPAEAKDSKEVPYSPFKFLENSAKTF